MISTWLVSIERRHRATVARTASTGSSRSPENLLSNASVVNATNPVRANQLHERAERRQQKYTAPKMPSVTPRSVVTSRECDAMFGSRVNTASSVVAVAQPKSA